MKEPKVTVSKGSNGLIVLADIGVGGREESFIPYKEFAPANQQHSTKIQ